VDFTSEIRRVGTALLARQSEIGRAITSRIVDELPEYRGASPELRADLLAGATEVAGLLAGAFAGNRSLRREDAAGVRALAARRVHQGLDFDVFLHAYRVALIAFWDACTEEAERLRMSRAAGYALAREAIQAIDAVTTQAAEGFMREDARVRTESGREARDLVERLITGRVPDDRRQRAAPGLDPAGPVVTVVGRVEHTELVAPGEALAVARDIAGERLAPPLTALRHDELVVIARHVARGDLEAVHEAALAHGIDVRFGLGVPAVGFATVQRAYREATLCLAYTSPQRPVVELGELSALDAALVGADATARAVIATKGRGLRALDRTEHDVAVDTVRAFAAADLNVTRTAAALHLHPNSVDARSHHD
jgi:hypothetical protein